MHFAFCLYKHFPYSGLSLDMLRIANETINRGHKVTVFTGSWDDAIPEGLNVTIVKAVGLTNHSRVHAFHRQLYKQISLQAFDVSVGFNKIPNMDFYFCGDYCFIGRSFLKHSFFYRYTPRFLYYSSFERRVFSTSSKTRILSLSPRERKIYQQYYLTQDSRFFNLPPTLEKSRWSNLDKLPERTDIRSGLNVKECEYLVLLIGSGFVTKGLDRAIRAVASLPSSIRDKTTLMVVGQSKKESFERLANNLSIGHQVRFMGGREDIPELMKAGDLLIHPAYAETSGGVLLEAIVSGLPVLATPVCGYAPHIEMAEAGYVLRKHFSQIELNKKLHEMLVSDQKARWRSNGLRYGKDPCLYVMPETVAGIIETPLKDLPRSSAQLEGQSIFIKRDLRSNLDGKESFNEIMNIEGRVYRIGPGRRTLRFQRGGKDYFLKTHTGVGWREIFKNLSYLRVPVVGAENEWQGIHRLNDLGIDTMTAAAYGIRGKNPATRNSFIVTEALPTELSLEEFCAQWKRNPPKTLKEIRLKRWILAKVINTARVMHDSGMNHRDFYLCHFLLDAAFDHNEKVLPESKLYVIDLHRIQLRNKTPERWLVKDIAGLYYSSMDVGLSKRDLFRFMKGYSEKPLREIFDQDLRFWRKVEARAKNLFEKEKFKTQIAKNIHNG